MDSDASGWLWLLTNLIMPVLLLAVIIYGVIRWRNRSRGPAVEQIRDQQTKENYRKEDAVRQG